MYIPNAASGNEWNRMATLSIRFYSLHPWVHCVLYKFVVFEIFVVEKHPKLQLVIIGNYCPRKMRLAASYKLFLFTYLTSVQCHKYMGTVVPLVYHPYSPSPISSTSVCPALKVLEYLFRSTEVLTKQYWSTDEEVLKCWRRSAEVLTKKY